MAPFFYWFLASAGAGCGAVVAWLVALLVGQPLKQFHELRAEAIRLTALYGNVRAEFHEGRLIDTGVHELEREEKARLEEAQSAYRAMGAKFHSFARTEPIATWLLSKLGLKAEQAARGLIGLSNTLNTYGEGRHAQAVMIQRALKFTD
jgi:hypothetical protein